VNLQRINAWGFVTATHRGRYYVQLLTDVPWAFNNLTAQSTPKTALTPEQILEMCTNSLSDKTVLTTRARVFRDTDIVPGDVVGLSLKIDESAPDLVNSPQVDYEMNLCRIEYVLPRHNLLMRTRDDKKTDCKAIAANTDFVGIVTATTSPDIQPEFTSRVIREAKRAQAAPLLLITKTDLKPLDLQWLQSTINYEFGPEQVFDVQNDFNELVDALKSAAVTTLIGLSGVGKSTLLNKLIPSAERQVGEVSGNGDGRHTSTSSEAFQLPNSSSFIVDTPGIRSFGLGHLYS
jgi:ribosome biogenesis GTPase